METLSSYTVECKACGGERRMQSVRSDLGRVQEYCARWCACPVEELVTSPGVFGSAKAEPKRPQ